MACLRRDIAAAALLLCAQFLSLAGSVAAGEPEPAAPAGADVFAAAKRIPAGVDLIVVVENAASLRTGEAAPAIRGLIDSFLTPGRTAKAWSGLAKQLGLSEDLAFDSLLGRRVTLIGRDIWSDEPSWALLSEVSLETALALVKRLPVAPRKIVANHPILSVEDGRFELTIERRADGATLLVGLAGEAALFDQIVPTLERGPARPLSESAALVELAAARRPKQRSGDLLVWIRLPTETPSWAGLLAWCKGREVEATLVSRIDAEPARAEPWPTSEWKALEAGSLLCIMERRPGHDRLGEALPAAVLSGMPWLKPDPETENVLADRHAFVMHPAPDGGLSLTVAIETVDPCRAAPLCDRMMNDVALRLSAFLGQGAWDYDFAGLFPDALRSVEITGKGGNRPAFIGGEPGAGFTLSWTHRAAKAAERAHGWLIAGTSRADVLRAAGSIVEADPRAGEGAWLSVGRVRPAALAQALRTSGQRLPAAINALDWVQSIGWHAESAAPSKNRDAGQGAIIRGGIRVNLRPDPAAADR